MTDGRLLLRAMLISTEDTIQKLDLLWEFCLQCLFTVNFFVPEVFVSKTSILLQFSTLYLIADKYHNVRMMQTIHANFTFQIRRNPSYPSDQFK